MAGLAFDMAIATLAIDDPEFPSCVDEAWSMLCHELHEARREMEAHSEAELAGVKREHFAWLDRYQIVAGGPPRRRWPEWRLASYPLTQPANRCQRCGSSSGLELDHMLPLGRGGPDHPHNLMRLCHRCHDEKPEIPPGASLAEARLAVIAWAGAS